MTKKELTSDEKLEILVRIKNRLFSGDLSQYVGDAVSYIIHNGKGAAILESIINYKWMTYNEKVATICLLRSAVFNAAWSAEWRVVIPNDPDDILKFWNGAESVIGGTLDLMLDIVETRFWRDTPQNGKRYCHTMVNCSTDDCMVEDRPYMFWWVTR